ncbi:MAG TPA: glycosyltransferase [Pyrinomonadaceae bacterium]|jgi:glycosyltransferase involved in cell wall biosynthesis
MPHRPKVSVTIPSYNHARYLPAAVESVLAQTFRDFELIITDDGSTDGSLEIAEGYAARHPALVRVLTHPGGRNLGISATANVNFRESRGDYWAGICSDDVWLPDKLERQVAFLDSRPGVGLVYGLAQVIDKDGQPQPQINGADITADGDPLARLICGNPIPAPTVMLRRRCLEEVGLHAEGITYGDWEQWIRILAHWDAGFIDRPLMLYRVHASNTSVNIEPALQLRYVMEVMLEVSGRATEVGGRLGRPRTRALVELQLSHLFFCSGDEAEAERRLASAFAADPSLAADAAYVARWLHDVRAHVYHARGGAARETDFSRWAASRLARVAGDGFARRLARGVRARESAAGAYENYGTDLRRAGALARDCLRADPRYARDRMLLTILFESALGERLAAPLRGFKRRLLGSK